MKLKSIIPMAIVLMLAGCTTKPVPAPPQSESILSVEEQKNSIPTKQPNEFPHKDAGGAQTPISQRESQTHYQNGDLTYWPDGNTLAIFFDKADTDSCYSTILFATKIPPCRL